MHWSEAKSKTLFLVDCPLGFFEFVYGFSALCDLLVQLVNLLSKIFIFSSNGFEGVDGFLTTVFKGEEFGLFRPYFFLREFEFDLK